MRTKGGGYRSSRSASFFPSEAYKRFSKDAIKQIWAQVETKQGGFDAIATPVRVTYVFYQKGRMRQDSANAQQAIDDVLQASGLLLNDSQIIKWSGEIITGAPDWKTTVVIERLT